MSATLPTPVASLRDAQATADFFGISLRCLWDITAPRGDLPCIRLGTGRGRVMYRESDIAAYVESRRVVSHA